jgi:hypothetical protein
MQVEWYNQMPAEYIGGNRIAASIQDNNTEIRVRGQK